NRQTVVAPGNSLCHVFFFSSRRRHTRFSRDWSSDVCSSDLASSLGGDVDGMLAEAVTLHENTLVKIPEQLSYVEASTLPCAATRSEERRVGKEGRPRRPP